MEIQTNNRYSVSYNYDDIQELNMFLGFVGNDDTREYKGKRYWSVSGNTLAAILSVVNPVHIDYNADFNVGESLKLPLYNYQKRITEYCLNIGKGIIVAPCGAGKTPILIALFQDYKKKGTIPADSKGLIVLKSSIKYQFAREITKFSDLTYTVLDTYKSATSSIQTKIKKKETELKKLLKNLTNNRFTVAKLEKEIAALKKEADDLFQSQFTGNNDIFICNYETLRDDDVRKALHKVNLGYIGADEVHYIKNDTSERSKALYEFIDVPARVGATASPLMKNPLDLYSISKFISPSTFPSKSAFSCRYLRFNGYGRVSGSQNEKELHEKLKDYMIIIGKEEVAKQLPETIVVTRYCQLEPKQLKMHEKLMEEIKDLKEQEASIIRRYAGKVPANNEEYLKVQAGIMARQTFASELADSEELLAMSDSDMAKKYITKSKSTKIELLLDLMEEILESGEKIAIFSKYKKLQDILTREINTRFPGIGLAYINGEITSAKRDEELQKFSNDDNTRCLLLSDAGAEGINLSNCKYLIEMEPGDSYSIQTQRRGRVERADSKFKDSQVFVYQLIAESSYDEIALAIVNKKEKYDAQIVQGNITEE